MSDPRTYRFLPVANRLPAFLLVDKRYRLHHPPATPGCYSVQVDVEPSMNPSDFQDIEELGRDIESLFLDGSGDSQDDKGEILQNVAVDEYGEIIEDDEEISQDVAINQDDDTLLDEENCDVEDDLDDVATSYKKNEQLAYPANQTQNSTPSHTVKTWTKRSKIAPNETDKEFELFKCYTLYGGGRSALYVSKITNISIHKITEIAKKNSWQRRAADYDRFQLTKRIKESQDSKHEAHLKRLEAYREEQEVLGRQLSLNAARIAFMANSTLGKMLDNEKELDVRDLPGMLNTAAKLAEVGKNLQGNALGVDQLLAALEEGESD